MTATQDTPAFGDWLRSHLHGTAEQEMGDAIRELIEAVQMTSKAGTATLSVAMKPAGQTLEVSVKVDAKLPRLEPVAANYFPHPDGTLRRNPYEQRHMFAPSATGETVAVDIETGEIQ
jgi:hypothetical protein